MMTLFLLLPLLLGQQAPQAPKNDPSGIWQTDTGSKYELRLTGKDLHVKIVPGSNPKFLQYEVDLKNEEEVNTYSGQGFFVAKMNGGKECKFPTQWRFIVVSPDHILGISSNVNADSKTCAIKEQNQTQLELKKKK
jgi:hypothetical protein